MLPKRTRNETARRRVWLRQHDPFLPLHWRWELAHQCARTGRRISKAYDGSWCAQARKMISALKLSGSELSIVLSGRHRSAWQTVAQAHNIWRSDGIVRWSVEARILARESNAQIAAAEGLSEALVDCYHDLYFAVRNKLGGKGFIAAMVLDQMRDLTGDDVRRLWAYYGYFAGSVVLGELIADFRNSGRTSYRDLEGLLDHDPNKSLPKSWMHRSIAMMLVPARLTERQAGMLFRLSVAHAMFQPRVAAKVIVPPVLTIDSCATIGALGAEPKIA